MVCNVTAFRSILVSVDGKVAVIFSGLFTGCNYVTMATTIFNFIIHLCTNDSWATTSLDVKGSQIMQQPLVVVSLHFDFSECVSLP